MLILLVLVPCGIVVAALAGYYAEYGTAHGLPSARWWGLAMFTGLTFWACIREFRRHWVEMSFCLTVVVLLAIHLAAYVPVPMVASDWPVVWFAFIAIAEVPVLLEVFWRRGYRPSTHKRKQHRPPK